MWHCGTPAILVLTCARHNPGHYRALEWSETEQKYVENPNLGILVEVDVSPAASPLYYTCAQHALSCRALCLARHTSISRICTQ